MRDVQYLAPTKRRSMTKARAAKIFLNRNGICYICGVQIRGEAYEIEHPDMLAAGGSDEDADLWPVHVKCHKVKTKKDRGDLAKRNDLITKGYKGKKTKPKSRFKRRIDGKVVDRETGEVVSR